MIDENGEVTFHDERCYNCGMCVGLCRSGALRIVERDGRSHLGWPGRSEKTLAGKGKDCEQDNNKRAPIGPILMNYQKEVAKW